MRTSTIPNPGSEPAVQRGCICAVGDNARGLGAYGGAAQDENDNRLFWMTEECPLHAAAPKDEPETEGKQHFILLGSAHHHFYFKNHEAYKNQEWFWVVPKSAKKGDTAFIYLAAPLSRIVGRVSLIEEPFFHVTGIFENKKMQNKWCCRIGEVESFDEKPEITMRGLRHLFGNDWRWLSYPRSHAKIPAEILEPFLELFK